VRARRRMHDWLLPRPAFGQRYQILLLVQTDNIGLHLRKIVPWYTEKMKLLFVFFLIILGGAFSLPLSCDAAGLVPCGGEGEDPCSICHLFGLLHNIITFFLVPSLLNPIPIVPVIATLLFAIGGFMLFAAAGNPSNLAKAKTIIVSTVVGLFIIYGSWAFIEMLLDALGFVSFGGFGSWWTITC